MSYLGQQTIPTITTPFYKFTNSIFVVTTANFTYDPTVAGQTCLIGVSGSGSITFNAPINITAGANYKIILRADDTNSRTYAWASAFKFPAGTPSLTSSSTTLNAYDIISFIGGTSNTLIYDGKQQDVR